MRHASPTRRVADRQAGPRGAGGAETHRVHLQEGRLHPLSAGGGNTLQSRFRNSPLMELQSSRCPPPHLREVPTMKIAARTAATVRWTAHELIDVTALSLPTLRTFGRTPGAAGWKDTGPLVSRAHDGPTMATH